MIKNIKTADYILDMIETLKEASEYMYYLVSDCKFGTFYGMMDDSIDMLNSIYNATLCLMEEEDAIDTPIMCKCIIDTIERIRKLSKARSCKILQKIEFELIPFIEEMYMQFYFWSSIYGDRQKMEAYYENEMIKLCANKYIDEYCIDNSYKYDLSIVVCAYNKLNYTRLCIESLLKYVPDDLKYELILVNHGSTDGTMQYFNEINPTKQLDVLINGKGSNVIYRIVEGRYTLGISNDVIITKDAISNMLECIKSNDKIALVVPTTPNVSNLQTIHAEYNDIEEMYKFAEENNISNVFRHEQRVKLCNPIELTCNEIFLSSKGIGVNGYMHSKAMFSFPDDKTSLLLRRKSYKMMLAKDAYCYHYGSMTLKEENSKYKSKAGDVGEQSFYIEGRKSFEEAFGVDPWGIGFCWSPELFEHLPCNETGHVGILGINCGLGSNPLKVRESIKENAHNLDTILYNVTDDKRYIEDLKGVSDVFEYKNTCSKIDDIFPDIKFKYIIFESGIEKYIDVLKLFSSLEKRLINDGVLAVKISNIKIRNRIKNRYSGIKQSGDWAILKK